jgi:transposase
LVIGYALPDVERLLLDIEVRMPAATCPTCGELSTAVHSYGTRRTVRDLDVWGRQCYLRFVPRQFQCQTCHATFVERLPWLESRRQQTRRFESQVYALACRSNVVEAARSYVVSDERVEDIFMRHATQQVTARGYPLVKELNVDEIAPLKGHGHYCLVLSSPAVGVLDVLEDRHKDTLEAWLTARGAEGCATVTAFHADMWRPYHEAARAKLPNGPITTADHFHVIKNLNTALGETRKALQRQANAATRELLKGSRWLLLKNPATLSETERARLADILQAMPELERNYTLKEDFRALYAVRDPQVAAVQLEEWLTEARAHGHAALQTFVTTVTNWRDEILSFFTQRGSNGFAEGVNNKIKLVLRRAFGCPNFSHFRLRIIVAFDS